MAKENGSESSLIIIIIGEIEWWWKFEHFLLIELKHSMLFYAFDNVFICLYSVHGLNIYSLSTFIYFSSLSVTSVTLTNCPMVWWFHPLTICIFRSYIILANCTIFFLDVHFIPFINFIIICGFPQGFKAGRTFSYDIITIVARLLEGW